MLKNLFGSQIRIDLLSRFLMHPGEEFYVRQLINELGANPRAVNRELKNLFDLGLIAKRIFGNQHYFSINQDHTIYSELRDIFIKTVGLRDVLKYELIPVQENIDYCFIYGSFAKGNYKSDSDIDILVIGKITSRKLASIFADAGAKLKREINYSVYHFTEIKKRLKTKDHFITTILEEPMLFLIGQKDEFRRVVKE